MWWKLPLWCLCSFQVQCQTRNAHLQSDIQTLQTVFFVELRIENLPTRLGNLPNYRLILVCTVLFYQCMTVEQNLLDKRNNSFLIFCMLHSLKISCLFIKKISVRDVMRNACHYQLIYKNSNNDADLPISIAFSPDIPRSPVLIVGTPEPPAVLSSAIPESTIPADPSPLLPEACCWLGLSL